MCERIKISGFWAGLFILCLANLAVAQQNKTMDKVGKIEVFLPMDDSVLLSTHVFIPKGKGPFPTVLVRTPYDKLSDTWMDKSIGGSRIAVVVQDTRGKYDSEGEFYPFIHERTDGLNTLRWIRSQPWSNGKVAGWGGSYVGYTQWAIADSLDLITPLLTGANLYDLIYPGGLFSMQTAYSWGFYIAPDGLNPIPPDKFLSSYYILPLSVADDSTINDLPYINDWLAHEQYDSYWDNLNFRGIARAPVFSVAGWYDIFLYSQISDFEALTDSLKINSRFIVGPWCHGTQGYKNEYGGEKKTGKNAIPVDFVKKYMLGKTTKMPAPWHDTRYNLFIMERNEYIGSDIWPPSRTQMTPYYLGPEHSLQLYKPPTADTLSYLYDPKDPFSSEGGTALGVGVGPALQLEQKVRKDQLVFETNIHDRPLILLGPVTARLWLSSEAPCTNIFVRLQDVFPDGKIINIQEGGARVMLDSEKPVRTEFSVWATGYQLNPGHKLRIAISSSWFPRFNRSLNTCEPIYNAIEMKASSIEVHYGAKTPSCINLPVYEIASHE